MDLVINTWELYMNICVGWVRFVYVGEGMFWDVKPIRSVFLWGVCDRYVCVGWELRWLYVQGAIGGEGYWGVCGMRMRLCMLGRGHIIMNGNVPSKSAKVKDSRPCRRLIIRVMTWMSCYGIMSQGHVAICWFKYYYIKHFYTILSGMWKRDK